VTHEVRVAVFRPDDERLTGAVELLDSLGATPVPDPMLAVEPTGAVPGDGADSRSDPGIVVLTSKTGVELLAESGWSPGDAAVACIGPKTAVAALDGGVGDTHVAVARSDHGSDVLTDGLADAGAAVTETVLYRLARPEGAGQSTVMAAGGELDAACFTSSLTVENFVEAAAKRGVREEAIAGLNRATVGAIGAPTRATATDFGIRVDVVPDNATFEALATAVVETAAPTFHE
jgi:uroporphyrinogen-III synthase